MKKRRQTSIFMGCNLRKGAGKRLKYTLNTEQIQGQFYLK
jgi:hypothetical protein